MPVPIQFIGRGNYNDDEKNSYLDLSFLNNVLPTKESSFESHGLVDKDAEDLMKIWLNAKKTKDGGFELESKTDIENKDVIRLKARGLLTGNTKKVKFTNRAKKIICTMTLGESNNFLKKRKEKSYSEILASMDKRNKPGYRTPRYSSYSHLINLKG